MQFIGKSKYEWGGGRNASDIAKGIFDCSSFVNYTFKQAGIDVGKANTTDSLKKIGVAVSPKDMQPGDMVFFDTYKKDGHVGIYMGDGKFIGAQSSTGVAVVDMNDKYWKSRFKGNVRRVSGGDASKSSPKNDVAAFSTIGQERGALGSKQGGSSYTNTYKTQKEALKSPGYQTYKGHLSQALSTGLIPEDWVVGLTELIGRESTWNPTVKNGQGSSAYGYGQFVKGTRALYEAKYPKLDYNNPVDQIILTAKYIQSNYGTPEKALRHWDKYHSY